jgi:hypothetical protein
MTVLTTAVARAPAARRTKSVANVTDEVQEVVPFAVPVGVPVAPFAPYFYSYQQTQAVAAMVHHDEKTEALPTATPESSTLPPTPAPSASIVVEQCAMCHGGQSPKAGLSLENPKTLSIANRLRAVQAVVTGKMPKGAQLSAEELHADSRKLCGVRTGMAKPCSASSSPPTAPCDYGLSSPIRFSRRRTRSVIQQSS